MKILFNKCLPISQKMNRFPKSSATRHTLKRWQRQERTNPFKWYEAIILAYEGCVLNNGSLWMNPAVYVSAVRMQSYIKELCAAAFALSRYPSFGLLVGLSNRPGREISRSNTSCVSYNIQFKKNPQATVFS